MKVSAKAKSRYCEFCMTCDKDVDCQNGSFCEAFQHTKEFTSLDFDDQFCEARRREISRLW
jgi:hypothetical protein